MAEWSKAPPHSPREQRGVGSNLTAGDKLVFAVFEELFDHSELGKKPKKLHHFSSQSAPINFHHIMSHNI